jgi:phytoene dehydrogenase-like protein
MDTSTDIAVVGAGLAGLSAAATAAAGGARVILLEAHRPGGRARTTERQGFVWNLGAHALYLGGPGAAVLTSLGVTPQGAPPPLRRYLGSYGGGLHRLPTGGSSLARSGLLGLRSKAQLATVLARLPRQSPGSFEGMSARQWIDDQGLRPDAESVVLALVRLGTYCADVDALGADAAVAQMQLAAAAGVRYLDGGWSQLTGALVAGVEVRAASEVRSVEPAAGRFELVGDRGRILADQVVVAVGGPAAARRLLPDPPDWGDLGSPVTAACLDLGVSRPPEPGYVLGIDTPYYATTQGPPARQAPPGGAVVGVLRYGARSAAEDREELDAHRRLAGVADDDIVVERFLASMTVASTAPRPERGGLRGRPGTDATGTPGIHLAGDWVGPDGLLADAALASGAAAARQALSGLDRTGRVP